MTMLIRRSETLLAIIAVCAIVVMTMNTVENFRESQRKQDAIIRQITPASNWFEVRSVFIEDSTAGVSPLMKVDRTVAKPFRGEWHVTIRQMVNGGDGYAVCIAEGASDYSAAASFPPPDKFNLDWWMYPIKCNLGPGRYRAYTLWRIFPDGYPEKQVRATSNTFTIK